METELPCKDGGIEDEGSEAIFHQRPCPVCLGQHFDTGCYFLIIFNLYTMHEARAKQADASRVALGLYSAQIEKSMEQMEKSLAGLVGNNSQLWELSYGNTIKTRSGYPLKIHTFCNFLACISLWTSIPRIL